MYVDMKKNILRLAKGPTAGCIWKQESSIDMVIRRLKMFFFR